MPIDTESSRVRPVVIMGVAGSGKSTVGALLAARLGVPFLEGDDAHSAAAKAQMAKGIPLTEAQRAPWLDRLHAELAAHASTGVVLACSALTVESRRRLAGDLTTVSFVALIAPEDALAARLAARTGHFVGPELLASQLATLELDPDVETVDAMQPLERVIDAAAKAARRGFSAR
jgi:gluconokinase